MSSLGAAAGSAAAAPSGSEGQPPPSSSSRKKFGKNLNKLTKPKPPPPSAVPASRGSGSSRNGLLLLSTKRGSATSLGGPSSSSNLLSRLSGGTAAAPRPLNTPSLKKSVGSESKSGVKSLLGGSGDVGGWGNPSDGGGGSQQQSPAAWKVEEKVSPHHQAVGQHQQPPPSPSSSQPPILAPKGGAGYHRGGGGGPGGMDMTSAPPLSPSHSRIQQQTMHPPERGGSIGSSDHYRGAPPPGLAPPPLGPPGNPQQPRGPPPGLNVRDTNGPPPGFGSAGIGPGTNDRNATDGLSKGKGTQKYKGKGPPGSMSPRAEDGGGKTDDDQVAYMKRLARERAEARRLEEEQRMAEQKERAARRLKELEQKLQRQQREQHELRREERQLQKQMEQQQQQQLRKQKKGTDEEATNQAPIPSTVTVSQAEASVPLQKAKRSHGVSTGGSSISSGNGGGGGGGCGRDSSSEIVLERLGRPNKNGASHGGGTGGGPKLASGKKHSASQQHQPHLGGHHHPTERTLFDPNRTYSSLVGGSSNLPKQQQPPQAQQQPMLRHRDSSIDSGDDAYLRGQQQQQPHENQFLRGQPAPPPAQGASDLYPPPPIAVIQLNSYDDQDRGENQILHHGRGGRGGQPRMLFDPKSGSMVEAPPIVDKHDIGGGGGGSSGVAGAKNTRKDRGRSGGKARNEKTALTSLGRSKGGGGGGTSEPGAVSLMTKRRSDSEGTADGNMNFSLRAGRYSSDEFSPDESKVMRRQPQQRQGKNERGGKNPTAATSVGGGRKKRTDSSGEDAVETSSRAATKSNTTAGKRTPTKGTRKAVDLRGARLLPRTRGVLYRRDERGNLICADGCDSDLGYGLHSVPGGRVRNPSGYARFISQQQASHGNRFGEEQDKKGNRRSPLKNGDRHGSGGGYNGIYDVAPLAGGGRRGQRQQRAGAGAGVDLSQYQTHQSILHQPPGGRGGARHIPAADGFASNAPTSPSRYSPTRLVAVGGGYHLDPHNPHHLASPTRHDASGAGLLQFPEHLHGQHLQRQGSEDEDHAARSGFYLPVVPTIRASDPLALLTDGPESPTLQATASPWRPSEAALLAATVTGKNTTGTGTTTGSPVPMVMGAPSSSSSPGSVVGGTGGHSIHDDGDDFLQQQLQHGEDADDYDDDDVNVDLGGLLDDDTESEHSTSFKGLGFDPTQNMDSVMMSPSLASEAAEGDDFMPKLTLDGGSAAGNTTRAIMPPTAGNPTADTLRNPFSSLHSPTRSFLGASPWATAGTTAGSLHSSPGAPLSIGLNWNLLGTSDTKSGSAAVVNNSGQPNVAQNGPAATGTAPFLSLSPLPVKAENGGSTWGSAFGGGFSGLGRTALGGFGTTEGTGGSGD